MKKLLLGGMLVASMFAQTVNAGVSTPVFSSAMGMAKITGEGCIFGKGKKFHITLSSDDETDVNHHKVMGRETFEREVTFKYSLAHLVECGEEHLKVTLTEWEADGTRGVEVLRASFSNTGGSSFNLSDGNGEVTLKVLYKADNPHTLLTKRFNYTHKLMMSVEPVWH